MCNTIPIPSALCGWATQQGFDCSNINSRIENGTSPLMQAALQGNLEILQQLIAAGADVNLLNDDENTALWFACVSNQRPVLQALLKTRCNLDNQNVNGATCLVYCASTGKLELVRELVEAGADIHRQTLDGYDALDSATTLPILKYLKTIFASASACAS